jgi:galactokinase/UDP-N-acetylglucosamine pyrophosphorylase
MSNQFTRLIAASMVLCLTLDPLFATLPAAHFYEKYLVTSTPLTESFSQQTLAGYAINGINPYSPNGKHDEICLYEEELSVSSVAENTVIVKLSDTNRPFYTRRGYEHLKPDRKNRSPLALGVLVGGLATRFGGAVKALKPIGDLLNRQRTFLEVKLAHTRWASQRFGTIMQVHLSTFATTHAIKQGLAENNFFGLSPDQILTSDRPKQEVDLQRIPSVEGLRREYEPKIAALTDPDRQKVMRQWLHEWIEKDQGRAGEVVITPQGDKCYSAGGHFRTIPQLIIDGTLLTLLKHGVKYLAISNIDNPGTTLDPALVGVLEHSGATVLVEGVQRQTGDIGAWVGVKNGRGQLVELVESHEHVTFDREFRDFANISSWIIHIKRFLKELGLSRRDLETLTTQELADRVERAFATVPSHQVHKELTMRYPGGHEEKRPVVQTEQLLSDLPLVARTIYVLVDRDKRYFPIKRVEDAPLQLIRFQKASSDQLLFSDRNRVPGRPISELLRELRNRQSAECRVLKSLYGKENLRLQQERYITALEQFRDRFPDASQVTVARAPGRVTIAGQHNDYNHAHILNFPIQQDTLFLASARADDQIHLENMINRFKPNQFGLNQCKVISFPNAPLDWADYVKAMLNQISRVAIQKNSHLLGMNLLVDGRPEFASLPISAGVSSSSALLVGIGLMAAALAQPPLPVTSSLIATAAMRAENSLGYPSGLQDPIGSLGGEIQIGSQEKNAVLIDPIPRTHQNEASIAMTSIPIPRGIRLILMNTAVPKDPSAWQEFNIRAEEAKLGSFLLTKWLTPRFPDLFEDPGKISKVYPDLYEMERLFYPPFLRPFYFTLVELKRVGLNFLRPELEELIDLLPTHASLTDLVSLGISYDVFVELTRGSAAAGCDLSTRRFNLQGSVRHVVTEQDRVERAVVAMRQQNIPELGRLQNEIFASLDQNYRVVATAAKELVKAVENVSGVLGARSLGGVWGSVVVVWLDAMASIDQVIDSACEKYYGPRAVTNTDSLILKTAPGTGANILFEKGENSSSSERIPHNHGKPVRPLTHTDQDDRSLSTAA